MVRPCKDRKIENLPCSACFKPSNFSTETSKVMLGVDEYEAIRLFNLEGLSNREGSKKMCISSSTFNRLVKQAHKKLTDAIVNGKCIYINCDKN